jgi:hypothetical protein
MTFLASNFFVVIFLISDSGYISSMDIKDQDNALYMISNEIDENKSVENLTQIDEICFSCLTLKYVHVEHCKKCDRCVKEFHHHCQFFNKCVGQNNARSFVLFLFIGFYLSLIYVIQMIWFSP